jgi:hypothetical protein
MKSGREAITTWKTDINRILHTFSVCSVVLYGYCELAINTHVTVSDVHHGVVSIWRAMVYSP